MSMTKYLPTLSNDTQIEAVNIAGVWDDKNKQVVGAISDAIETSTLAKIKGVSAVPDVWARPLLFGMALFDDKHPLHSQIKSEWRGLLALIAVSNTLHLDLKIDKVSLDDAGLLARAMQRVEPRAAEMGRRSKGYAHSYAWRDVYVIKYNGLLVGGTSPETIFYTAADYGAAAKELAKRGIEVQGNLLVEPRKDEVLPYVKQWLKSLVEGPNPNENALMQLVLEYSDENATGAPPVINALQTWYSELSHVRLSKAQWKPELSLIKDQGVPVYHYFSTPLEEGAQQEVSDLYLLASKSGARKYIIMSDSSFKLSNDPIVWNMVRVSNVLDEFHKGANDWANAHGETLNGNALPPATEWVRPETYFLSDQLLTVETGSLVLDRDYNQCQKSILPIKRELLECFQNNDDLLKLKPRFQEEGNDIIFSIDLPMAGPSGGSKTHITISRRYAAKPTDKMMGRLVEVPDPPPLLELWPDFNSERWTKYFICYDQLRDFSYEPFTHRPNMDRTIAERQLDNSVRLERFGFFPDAVFVTYCEQTAGAVLVRGVSPGRSESWEVGVDFGTSNTNIWYRRGPAAEQQIELTVVPPLQILNVDKTRRESLLAKYFLPATEPRVPFVTMLRAFDGSLGRALLDSAIKFLESNPQRDPQLRSDVKWSTDGTLITAFLQNLGLLIEAQALKAGAPSLTLRVSYPVAFSTMQLSRYQSAWQTVVKDFCVYSGTKVNEEAAEDLERMPNYSESVCAGYYFQNRHQATAYNGSICVDIGGGTSDVSVWSENNIKYNTSILLAGNLISDCFRQSRGVCEVMFQNLDAKYPDPNRIVDDLQGNIQNANILNKDSHFASVLNYYFREYRDPIFRRIPGIYSSPYFEKLLDVIMVEYGAIMYYCCMVLDSLRSDPQMAKLSDLRMAWGGGGSAYLRWLDSGNLSAKGGAASTDLFTTIARKFGYKSASSLITTDPKAESAYGLVCSRDWNVRVKPRQIIIGEDIVLVDTKEITYKEEIDGDGNAIKEFADFPGSSPLGPQFTKFIEVLNEFRKKNGFQRLRLDKDVPDLSDHIRNSIGLRAKKLKEEQSGEEIAEPIFVIEVREFIRMLIKNIK